jgi:hypothetical protein
MDRGHSLSHRTEKLEGRYANHFAIGYNAWEFIFDFGQSYSEHNQPELYTRIITGPVYAKAFLKTLKESIEAFENAYGEISDKALGKSED